MHFSDLGLAEELVRAVTEHGYTTPTPIQAQAIPTVLDGRDLMAGAQTGTGKTAGFVLPILQRLSDPTRKGPANGRAPVRALILTPTRELAAQVEESVRTYGRHTKLNSLVVFGGVSINPQISRLKGRVDILVATPGRLLDLAQQKLVDLSQVEILVLDEADRMLDMGFIRDIRKIIALLPKQRQNLLFSATFSDEIKLLADGLLSKPVLIEVARRNATADLIAQKVYEVNRDEKRQVLSHLIKTERWTQVLVFTRTKHGANRLAEQLLKDGIASMAIHGNKSQTARTKALAEFKKGDLRVLVATDIAARGIDISELPHVVNYELPNVPEDYVHRIGRTGRAGSNGEAISLVCVDELDFLRNIERLTKRSLPRAKVDGFEPDPNARAQPIQLRSQQNRGAPARGAHAGKGRPGGKASQPASTRPGGSKPFGGKPGSARPGTRSGSAHRSGGRHR
ncbi:DEAD/DEAH box helicase [Thioalkalivibrio sp.]|uniref:DEAD/DEAH box helicase n=1 Tax=Thioalkalivibrio sp. TaxID=2093813 RepID=UPI0012D55964|nr:DEAD/DEAH box helicase [Thioalkalivibrio sp.]TVP79039.1 MAG: DEAD/DEAH box helicase [Thioalkalivibrio sp.]